MTHGVIDRRSLSSEEEEILRRVAANLASDITAVADEVTRRVLARHPALARPDDRIATIAIRRSTIANVGAVLSTLAFAIPPDSVDPPEGALDLIALVAKRGDQLAVLLRGYRIGATEAWNALVAPIMRQTDDPQTLARLLAVAHAHIDDYADHLAQVITERWDALARDSVRSQQQRSAALQRVLDGEAVSLSTLDYPLDTTHVAIAVTASADTTLAATADSIEASLDGLRTIGYEAELQPVRLMWFAGCTSAGAVERSIRPLTDGSSVHVAVSDIASGRDGFLTVRREALDTLAAVRVLYPSGGILTYREGALAATLLADPERATRLAEVVLGPLGKATPAAARLRATLRAYFAADYHLSTTATVLQVHEKTVAYRLRQAADHLGFPPRSRRAELEAALSVRRD